MLELFQHEGSPDCAKVRQKLSEMMLDFVTRQVGADPERRTRLKLATGQTEVPALVDPVNGMIVTEADDIIAYLEETHGDPKTAP
ncbi:MAG TPA: glutathione S-transferase N-terminal domain-containing protein [Candidatus Polarisedimenticolia bacterium]|jgi:glutathione S-transferase